jgi:hypothetical protein
MDHILAELSEVSNMEEDTYKTEFLKIRMESVQLAIPDKHEMSLIERK